MELIGELIGGRRGSRTGCREWIYVVVHRSHGPWTHVYVAVEFPGRNGTEIRLIRVMAGDRLGEARAWALAMWGEDVIGRRKADDDLYRRGLVWCRRNLPAGKGESSIADTGAGYPDRRRPTVPVPSLPVESAFAGIRAEHREEVSQG